MSKKLLAIGSALALTLLSASTASALTIGDANYVGVIIDGIPPNDALEPRYVNSLILVAPGDSAQCSDPLVNSEVCDRTDSTLAIALPPVDLAGQFKANVANENSGDVLVNGWEYISGKYGSFGIHVWYIGNLAPTDTVTLPQKFNGGTTGPGGLSHYTLYNANQFDVPDGGTTAALLGLSLVGLGMIRRRINL
jgi:hypothetical protein